MADGFLDDFFDETTSISAEMARIGTLADGVARSLTNAFRGAIAEGRSFRSVLSQISAAFADIALRAALRPLGTLVEGVVSNLFTATNPAVPFAKGGVIASPTYFPLGQGLGLAGEAGPEAILPLARGSDGRLGVAAGSGAAPINVTFNVTATDARSFAASEAELSAMLLRAVRRGTRAS
ncbi:phage tail tape measure protein [Devosia geojensis]|nr:phage tail tape measure protein [Devosia geojensis]